MSKTKQILKNIEAKEKTIKEALDNATASDFSEKGKIEMIDEVENMINKLEEWKAAIQNEKVQVQVSSSSSKLTKR